MRPMSLVSVVSAAVLLSACVVVVAEDDVLRHAPWHEGEGGHSTVNRSIRVPAGASVGHLESVNGSIELGDGSRAAGIETVNGGIRLGEDAIVESVESVNGNVRGEGAVRVARDIETVNGGVELVEGSVVSGGIESVNGRVLLAGTEVAGAITTVWGDIDLGRDSRVGSIRVEKPQGHQGPHRAPRVVIGPGSVVSGPMAFEHEVELYVHESAKTGEIRGAQAQRYSGNAP